MGIANAIAIDALSFAILTFLFAVSFQRAEKAFVQHRLYLAILACVALLLILDTLCRLNDGRPGQMALFMDEVSNMLLYIFRSVVVSLWVLYADYQVNRDEKRIWRCVPPLVFLLLANAAASIATVWTGWYFSFVSGNAYHRGPYIFFHAVYCYALMFYTAFYILAKRKQIERKHFFSLFLFAFPPAIGSALQILFYGTALIWSGMTLSILMIYVNIQDRRLHTDYLTGTYNRRLLDSYVGDRIKSSAKGKTFSAILIDLDDFKRINDSFGHDAGDGALLDVVALLRGCLRHGDLISRYGGDEFLIILDIGDRAVLEDTIERIRCCFERFNKSGGRPYELRFSTGYAVYDMSGGLDPDQFIKHIDTLMYEDKKRSGGAAQKAAAPAV